MEAWPTGLACLAFFLFFVFFVVDVQRERERERQRQRGAQSSVLLGISYFILVENKMNVASVGASRTLSP